MTKKARTKTSSRVEQQKIVTEDQDTGEKTTILFSRKPEVLFKTFSASSEEEAKKMAQIVSIDEATGSTMSTLPGSPVVTWLFFNRRRLAAIVKLDGWNLPCTKSECRTNWPTHLVINRYYEISEAVFAHGERFHGEWIATLVPFDDSFVGTKLFWEPLLDHSDFGREDRKAIYAIAKREGTPEPSSCKTQGSVEQTDAVLLANDSYSLLEFDGKKYNISRALTQKAIEVLLDSHPDAVNRKRWFEEVYLALNRETPTYQSWKPLDWFRGNHEERQFYDDLVQHNGRLYQLKPHIRGVKIH